MSVETINILFVGDVIGKPGRRVLTEVLPELRRRHRLDSVIVNVENSAGGFGLTHSIYGEYERLGVDVMTGGNHIWDRREILDFIEAEERLLRPINYPSPCAGRGMTRLVVGNLELVVINVMGRVFMVPLDCPFRAVDSALRELARDPRPRIVIVDLHCEATSEKMAMGHYLNGRVSAVVGTHTHVPTADERVLSKGTAYITDAGMTGPYDSVIGMDSEAALHRFLTGISKRFTPATRDLRLSGVVMRFDPETGRALSIERVNEPLPSAPCDWQSTSGA